MTIGTVKWFNESKGYGFIVPAEGGDDVFVHTTAIDEDGQNILLEGQLVNFEINHGPKGLQAAHVKVAD